VRGRRCRWLRGGCEGQGGGGVRLRGYSKQNRESEGWQEVGTGSPGGQLVMEGGREGGLCGVCLFLDEHEQPCIAEEGFLFKAKE
jgi:hypothetical protein